MTNVIAKAEDLIKKGNADAAVEVLRNAAQSGDAEASYQLGLLYYRGDCVPGNIEHSRQWLKVADKNSHMKATYYLGRLCTYEGDHKAAMEWYEKSAHRGYHVAMARIGLNYQNGDGVEKSSEKAFEYFSKAKNAGNLAAHIKVARILIQGRRGFWGIFLAPIEFIRIFYLGFKFLFSNSYRSPEDMKEKLSA